MVAMWISSTLHDRAHQVQSRWISIVRTSNAPYCSVWKPRVLRVTVSNINKIRTKSLWTFRLKLLECLSRGFDASAKLLRLKTILQEKTEFSIKFVFFFFKVCGTQCSLPFFEQTDLCFQNEWDASATVLYLAAHDRLCFGYNCKFICIMKKSCFGKCESPNDWLCGMKWGCVASLETLRHIQGKDKLQIWLIPHVAEEQCIGSCERRKVRCGCSDRREWSWINNGTQFMFCSLAPKLPQLSCFCFLRRWRFQNVLFPKGFCWKDQHLLRTHVQIIMCSSSKCCFRETAN